MPKPKAGKRVPTPPSPPAAGYDAKKAYAAAKSRALSQAGRDIGAIPEVADPVRRERCRQSFREFAETYFQETFALAWSPDHLRVIERIEQAVTQGGLFALAMPRGAGKTSLAETACLWAALYGLRDFIALIGASEAHATEMLQSLKRELDGNELLAADFPEVCYPIAKLEGMALRCHGQTYRGERTHIGWTTAELVLPTIPESLASGVIVKVAGLTGRIRGMKFKRPDGRPARPSLVILDDPQTDESARSLSQCASRERLVAGAVLGLAGPGRKISGIMPLTVIRPGDMADVILDREKHPEWNGERTKMLCALPTATKLWEQYAEIRADSLREHHDILGATAFYRANREAMDEGAVAAWPERFNHDEISAVQHAMNLKLQDERAFFAEYQNDPLPEDDIGGDDRLSIDDICGKVNGLPRGRVPLEAEHLTAFIDVQGRLLFWLVVAWRADFTGYVLDYGAYPDQHRPYFTLADAQRTLQLAAKGAGQEGAIHAGLETLVEQLLGREWERERDAAPMRIGRCLIDANWATSTGVVYAFCRASKYAASLYPSHGKFVGASSQPMDQYRRKAGDRLGHNWRIPSVKGKQAIRHVVYDTNHWKSFAMARLAVPMGDRGCLSLFGRDRRDHQLLAEHLTAEFKVRTEGRGRVVDEWKQRPERRDNHWLDCLVGAAVAASIQGVSLSEGSVKAPTAAKPALSLSALQKARRAASHAWR